LQKLQYRGGTTAQSPNRFLSLASTPPATRALGLRSSCIAQSGAPISFSLLTRDAGKLNAMLRRTTHLPRNRWCKRGLCGRKKTWIGTREPIINRLVKTLPDHDATQVSSTTRISNLWCRQNESECRDDMTMTPKFRTTLTGPWICSNRRRNRAPGQISR
jgi:hypothetical protein